MNCSVEHSCSKSRSQPHGRPKGNNGSLSADAHPLPEIFEICVLDPF
jgi:hypothetical protein